MKRIALTLCMFLLLSTVACFSGEVTLAWDYADDAALGEQGGFRIYTSKLAGTYPPLATTTVPAGTHTAKFNLPNGTYYFVATAYDSEGNESGYSNEVSGQVKPSRPLNLRITEIK